MVLWIKLTSDPDTCEVIAVSLDVLASQTRLGDDVIDALCRDDGDASAVSYD